jgi:hypothetical protein
LQLFHPLLERLRRRHRIILSQGRGTQTAESSAVSPSESRQEAVGRPQSARAEQTRTTKTLPIRGNNGDVIILHGVALSGRGRYCLRFEPVNLAAHVWPVSLKQLPLLTHGSGCQRARLGPVKLWLALRG